MNKSMPRPRPPHLHREVTRHKKVVWYVRLNMGPRVRIRAELGTPEFDVEYTAAVTNTAPRKITAASGTLAWLVARYRESVAWEDLSSATRQKRDQIFRHVLEAAGNEPFNRIDTTVIQNGIERRARTPSQARHFLDAMRGLFKWAKKNGHVSVDPTDNAERPARKKTEGFTPWTEEMVEAYQRHWALGTRQRVWLDVLLYTGLRRGDAVRLGRQHIKDGVGSVKTEKTGMVVTLPILPVLAQTLAAGQVGDMTFIVGSDGLPFHKQSFGNAFAKACKLAGVDGSAHGIRKLAATRMADAGASEAELEAVFGWSGGHMASLYTRKANRTRLAQSAMDKVRTSYLRT
jgi:integrase